MDARKNFSYGTVLTAPTPAASGTTLILNSGQGARFPAPATDGEFNIVVKPFREIPTSSNAEICRVTARTTDTLTITREQESSSARTIIATDEVFLAMTKKTLDDMGDKVEEAPRGFLLNGKIVPSVATNDLTVAIKTLSGDDPSIENSVKIRIGDTVRSITAALSVTRASGTNWCASGAAKLATKEIDYFVYLGYNATDGVVIGFSRVASGREYDSFHATTTNEKYCAISTITNAAAGDDYELIGRFAATLSAGAGYTWTVPTFTNKNLIQRPIYETRWLDWTPVVAFTAGTDPSSPNADYTLNTYKLINDTCHINFYRLYGSAGATVTVSQFSLPMNWYAHATAIQIALAATVVPLVGTTGNIGVSNNAYVYTPSYSMTQLGATGSYEY